MNVNIVTVKILFFAGAKDITGKRKDSLNIKSPINYDDLLDSIVCNFALQELKDCVALSLNEKYCEKHQIFSLKSGDELAVIPPLSGG